MEYAPISYVVASTPRSATGYISRVLNLLGLKCGHEAIFTTNTESVRMFHHWGIFGDASWMAVPLIHSLPPNTLVLHQIRDPVKSMNSINSGNRYFRGGFGRSGIQGPGPYCKFIAQCTQGWVWPEDEVGRGAHFWHNWHRWIEFEARRRDDLRYFRYRIEDLDEGLLVRIANLIAPSSGPNPYPDLGAAVESVPTNHNHQGEVLEVVSWDTLPPPAKEMAIRYGY